MFIHYLNNRMFYGVWHCNVEIQIVYFYNYSETFATIFLIDRNMSSDVGILIAARHFVNSHLA